MNRSRNCPQHLAIGDALGYHGKVVTLLLRCLACSATQRGTIDAGVPRSAALADVTCESCGRLGQMRWMLP